MRLDVVGVFMRIKSEGGMSAARCPMWNVNSSFEIQDSMFDIEKVGKLKTEDGRKDRCRPRISNFKPQISNSQFQ